MEQSYKAISWNMASCDTEFGWLPASTLPCSPLTPSHNALQELREIHCRQQRQKQKESEGYAHTQTHPFSHAHTQNEKRSAELQDIRQVTEKWYLICFW